MKYCSPYCSSTEQPLLWLKFNFIGSLLQKPPISAVTSAYWFHSRDVTRHVWLVMHAVSTFLGLFVRAEKPVCQQLQCNKAKITRASFLVCMCRCVCVWWYHSVAAAAQVREVHSTSGWVLHHGHSTVRHQDGDRHCHPAQPPRQNIPGAARKVISYNYLLFARQPLEISVWNFTRLCRYPIYA